MNLNPPGTSTKNTVMIQKVDTPNHRTASVTDVTVKSYFNTDFTLTTGDKPETLSRTLTGW